MKNNYLCGLTLPRDAEVVRRAIFQVEAEIRNLTARGKNPDRLWKLQQRTLPRLREELEQLTSLQTREGLEQEIRRVEGEVSRLTRDGSDPEKAWRLEK